MDHLDNLAPEWEEYYRRLKLRDARRHEVRKLVGWSNFPGWGRMHRSQFQTAHPMFGGKVAAAVDHHKPGVWL